MRWYSEGKNSNVARAKITGSKRSYGIRSEEERRNKVEAFTKRDDN